MKGTSQALLAILIGFGLFIPGLALLKNSLTTLVGMLAFLLFISGLIIIEGGCMYLTWYVFGAAFEEAMEKEKRYARRREN